MAKPQNLDPFQGVYGLPPSTWVSDGMITNSMPVLEILPCEPQFDSGLNLFSVTDASTAYLKVLANHGFTTKVPIKIAFLADNFPTDTFTNDYGETFLQKFTDVASQGVSQLIQMTGSKDLSGALGKVGSMLKETGEGLGEGTLSGILKAGGGGAQSIAGGLQNLKASMEKKGGASGVIGGGIGLIDKMLGGHRVDFPQVWRNSGFTPSYTATVRLYNPNPGSVTATTKYIIGPLAVLLCLAIPRSDNSHTYNWPFFHKVRSTGIYNLDPAVITNITIVKGGDQQQIAYNQKLSMVDVRLDFASLFGSMLVEEQGHTMTNRPTVRSYLQALLEDDGTLSTKRNATNVAAASRAGSTGINRPIATTTSVYRSVQISKNEAAKKRQAPKIDETPVGNRVSTFITAEAISLLERSDPSFIPSQGVG